MYTYEKFPEYNPWPDREFDALVAVLEADADISIHAAVKRAREACAILRDFQERDVKNG